MAMGFRNDAEFDPEGGISSDDEGAPTASKTTTTSDPPPKRIAEPKSQGVPPPASPVSETKINISGSFRQEQKRGPSPSWTDEFSGPTGNAIEEEDEGEPICPLSMFSSIAEANTQPVKREEKKPSWDPPPRPDWQQSQRPSPPKQEPPSQATVPKKMEEKPKPRMAQKPRNASNAPQRGTGRWTPDVSIADFRAKYAFLEDDEYSLGSREKKSGGDKGSEPAKISTQMTPSPSRQFGMLSSREEDEMLESKIRLTQLEEEIYTMNGSKFNLKSYKQVAKAVFGDPEQSTSKEVLEGVAGSNIKAKLVLEYRQVSKRLSKLEKRKTNRVTRVKSVVGEATATQAPSGDDTAEESAANGNRLLLLDTSSFIFRAYYSMPPLHRSTDGTPVGAVLGFCNMLNRLLLNSMLEGKRPYIVLCKDASGPTFRNELYDGYKANRAEAPMDLIPQFDLIYEAAEAYGLVQISAPGYEADDVIATLCKQATEKNMGVDILSGDKDLMQLITNSTTDGGAVTMIDPMTMNRMTHDTVVEKWGVPSHKLGDLLALAGDSADNIPGVPGIGPKIAAQLLEEYGSLEDLLENSDQVQQKKRREKIQENEDMARLSRDLVTLVSDVPADLMNCIPEQASSLNIEEFRMEPMDADRILEFYDSMRFFTIKQRLLQRLEQQERVAYEKKQHPQQQKKKTFSTKPKKVEPPKPEDYEGVPF
eukprot:CAMPEP_0113621036 /NCGR_PEP_ID=MMETSP0017_2-20120614/10740_1 /TAXON_ID=2856 /ORGANISM="Cylindrotheca closterium" /LENGTH=704 /DNA_ID=CAMNT_0000530753 /DNA_START=183 /DNA_END=2297 /DNA_ORIENTATION=- /assembly_acc=CAM_ASM_000147